MKRWPFLIALTPLLASPSFAGPANPAEQALLQIIDAFDQNPDLLEPILGRSEQKTAETEHFARHFSPALRKALHAAESDLVQQYCGGVYRDGELCGLDYTPLTCAQDVFGSANAVLTSETNGQNQTIISYRTSGDDTVIARYRMQQMHGAWIIDGIDCDYSTFNWPKN
jgi:hypothetical protein